MSDIIIIGGGAAGFMAAITAAETNRNAKVTILDRNRTVLNKVRISGGGRCNVTNSAPTIDALCRGYPRGAKFLRPLFQQFNNYDTIRWFEERGVKLKTEPDGRIFPVSDSSQSIINCLLDAAQALKIDIETNVVVNKLFKTDSGFELKLMDGSTVLAEKVIVATGGFPQANGYEWLKKLRLNIILPVPSLFTFNVPDSTFHALSGVSVQNTRIKIAGTKIESNGALLFTHWGLSGPAILKASAWAARELAEKNYEFTALVNFTNLDSNEAMREYLNGLKSNIQWRNKLVKTQSISNLPQRLWQLLIEKSEISPQLKWSELPAKNLNRLAEFLSNCPFLVAGKTTFKEEFVTCGGVSLLDVQPKTMEAQNIVGLFLVGEVLDIDGITGGYNFQSAWTTGYIAGKNVLSQQ